MSDREQGSLTRWVCSNCRHHIHTDHEGQSGPICPDCQVQEMTEFRQPECGDCDSTTFTVYDGGVRYGRGPRSCDPQIECVECGWIGRVDDDGVWY